MLGALPEGHIIIDAPEKREKKPLFLTINNASPTNRLKPEFSPKCDIVKLSRLITESENREVQLREIRQKSLKRFIEKFKARKLTLRSIFSEAQCSQTQARAQVITEKAALLTESQCSNFPEHNILPLSMKNESTFRKKSLLNNAGSMNGLGKLYEEVNIQKNLLPMEDLKFFARKKITRKNQIAAPDQSVKIEPDLFQSSLVGTKTSKGLQKILHKARIINDWNKFALKKQLDPKRSFFYTLIE